MMVALKRDGAGKKRGYKGGSGNGPELIILIGRDCHLIFLSSIFAGDDTAFFD